MSARRAITILVILIALILTGTVIVLTTVVQYFGVDSRDIINEGEMRLYERLAAQAAAARPSLPGSEKEQKVVVGGDRAKESEGASQGAVDAEGGNEDEPSSVQELMDRLDERGWFGNSSTTAAPVVSGDETANEPNPSAPATRKPRVPKIIHATWKTDVLPDNYEMYRQNCMDLHPDYEFKLWSDASSRKFIEDYYPWFLPTFDGYTYPIQRADVIRYFVLHRYGGVYMDLDIGCRRNMDPLLYFPVILPATIPVGVSNDLMFAEKNSPFMDLVIHNLITFDHTYGTNYPTVMFSTGPMFLSASYGLWPKELAQGVERQVRILPRRWYGKNAPPTQMEDSFFDHYYGSSWHAEDAGFITFLGKFGKLLMYAGLGVVVFGIGRLVWSKRFSIKSAPIALPYEALGRASTGSRPASPVGGHRGVPPPPVKGGLFYMPVWLMPTGEGRTPEARPAVAGQGGNWSQYFSNMSFVDEEAANRYHPVPNFSRPPSPSNNSILHAPGAMHDGAFDGTPLHSIHTPTRSSIDSSYSSSPHPPMSPTPPAYSALRSWGTSLFRASPFSASPRAPLLPLSAASTTGDDFSSPRAKLPAPPAYADAAGTASSAPGPSSTVGDPRSRSPRAGGFRTGSTSGSGSGVGSSSPTSTSSQAGDRSEYQTSGGGVGSGRDEVQRGFDRSPVTPGFASAASSAANSRPVSRNESASRRGSAMSGGGMGIGGRVEEEVDRLLSEMAPGPDDKKE